MLKPQFLLTKKIPLTILRSTQGSYVDGEWVEGAEVEVPLEVNIQPFRDSELMLLPEADRSKEWYKLYCADELRTAKQGTSGWEADEFILDGDRYKVMKVKPYDKMGILDHWKAHAARLEISAE
jgi:hypothetical protein